MKKTKKALASLAIAGMALTTVPFNAFADGAVPTRLAGTTAAQTANAIADQTGWTGTAILASSTSYGMVDALTAGPLATYLKAPILLTGAGSTLDADTKAELTKLSVKTVYVTSGTAVISQGVLDELTGMGITVVPLGGMDRAETSVNIAKKMSGVTKVAVANGIPDALSIASIASAANEPILLTDKDSIPASVSAYLAANSGITSSDVIGGTGIISDAVKGQFPSATRHAGMTAYDTNNQVIQDFASQLQFSNVFVANGETRIDALAGAPLAAQTKSPIVLTNGTAPAAASFVHGKLASGAVVTALGGMAVVPDSVLSAVQNGQVDQSGPLSVTSVTATGADTFKVVFNHAPADTSKVTFDVENFSTPMTVTTTWNSGNTEATLQNSANFPQGTYTVDVKDDTTDLGTTSVTVDQQKIAAINITATKLGVVTNKDNTQTGYATYQVLDQYGNDITTGGLANSLSFQSGVGSVDAKDGLLTLDSNVQNLMQFSTVVITGYDSTSGVSTSATLTTSTQVGTLSDFKLGELTNADGKKLTDGDSSVFYASYTATDISGNPTTSYDLIKGGLILHSDGNGNDNLLTTSNSYVQASVEEDPSDSNKAVIKVIVNNTSGTSMTVDMPTVITAMTWSGTTSTLNTTLYKSSKIDSFTIMAPADSIAVDECKQIPFRALDQNGQVLTKWSDLSTTDLTITNAFLKQNSDGTASLWCGPSTQAGFGIDGQQVITANTATGKYSSITINIQKAAKADTLQLDQTVLATNMQSGSAQGIDFGWNYGGLTVKDQYGRVIDMQGKFKGGKNTTADPNFNYQVVATATGDLSVVGSDSGENLTGGSPVIYGGNGVRVVAKSGLESNGGSGTVRFDLVNLAASDPTAVIDSKSVTISVLKNNDIKDYYVDTVTDPIYVAEATDEATATPRQNAYAAEPFIYGKSASGSKVILTNGSVLGASVDSKDFFAAYTPYPADPYSEPYDWQNVYVYAKKLGDNVTSSNTTLNVTVKGADGLIHSVTTPIQSSTATPTPTGIYVSSATFKPGVTINDLGDDATVSVDYMHDGTLLERFDSSGSNSGRSPVYIYAKDQYGTKAIPLSYLSAAVTRADGSTSSLTLTDGRIPAGTNLQPRDKIILSGVASGFVKTLEIDVTDSVAGDTTAPTVTGVTDGQTYTAAVTPASTDTDIASVSLTKDGTAVANYALGTAISDNGAYVLTVKDTSGNTTIVNFTVNTAAADTTAPTVTGVTDGQTYTAAVTPASADTDIASVSLTKDGTAVADYALGTAISDNGAYVLTVKDASGNTTTVNFTVNIAAADTLSGNFDTLLGQPYAKVTLPTGYQAVTAVTVDGAAKTEGADYTIDSGVLTIVNVTSTNSITITVDGTTYTVVPQ
ncbi:cell wall-binding repeat-containing protein [Desulfosporosinus sp. PR]|uniref:cell wall-binding repeat-containing protein n=1 Tax=Candidatus Desulfosporosinus nitrosoreducens TaxID=3401928 RepID=UPI0027EF393F|nr:cell wall-binding repeat-containing protein [Desulfosporosinus sp. PR]MDQ7095556.1 cell wall-binding repeat-containing protein [Desulfosporosinus sp. PR]